MPLPKSAKKSKSKQLRKLSPSGLAKRFLKPKPIKVVTRKVLEKIADDIYNPKTGLFLNLCEGTLQNGPDPVCETRSMHCGLGELYFVVTGKQPQDDGVNEEEVIDEITKRSTIHLAVKAEARAVKKGAVKSIKKLGLPPSLEDELLQTLSNYDDSDDDLESDFRECLNEIPEENDLGGDNAVDFPKRAERVAACIRAAAQLLPK